MLVNLEILKFETRLKILKIQELFKVEDCLMKNILVQKNAYIHPRKGWFTIQDGHTHPL